MHTIMNTHIQKHLKKECVSIYNEVHSKLELQVGRFGHWSKMESTYLTYFHILLKWWSWQTFGAIQKNGILLPKLFWPTVRKNCSSDREKRLKFEAEGREFSNFSRSLYQFIQTVKGQNNFW